MSDSPVESLLEQRATNGAAAAELPDVAADEPRHGVPVPPDPGSSQRRGVTVMQALRWTVDNLGPRKLSAIYLFALFFVVFTAINPNTFPTSVTFRLVFSQGTVTCILALAFLIPLAAN